MYPVEAPDRNNCYQQIIFPVVIVNQTKYYDTVLVKVCKGGDFCWDRWLQNPGSLLFLFYLSIYGEVGLKVFIAASATTTTLTSLPIPRRIRLRLFTGLVTLKLMAFIFYDPFESSLTAPIAVRLCRLLKSD